MNEQQKKKSRVGIGRMAKLMWVRAVGWGGRALGNLFYYGARRLRQRLGPWWHGTGRKMAVSGFCQAGGRGCNLCDGLGAGQLFIQNVLLSAAPELAKYQTGGHLGLYNSWA